MKLKCFKNVDFMNFELSQRCRLFSVLRCILNTYGVNMMLALITLLQNKKHIMLPLLFIIIMLYLAY